MIRSRLLWLKHLIFAAFALVLLIGVAEVSLRVYDSATGQITRKKLYDRGLSCKSWFTHHSLRPSQKFQVREPDSNQMVRVSINSFGCRGPELTVPKSPGTFRIVCLGDEQTLAAQIADEETACRIVEAELRSGTPLTIEVINAGMPDCCPLLSFLQMRHQLLALQPDLIVLQCDASDVAEDHAFRRTLIASRTGQPLSCAHPDLELRGKAATRPDMPYLLPMVLAEKCGGLFAERVLAEQPQTIDSPTGRYAWLDEPLTQWKPYVDLMLEPIGYLAKLSAELDVPLVVTYLPAPWQVSSTAGDEDCRRRWGIGSGSVLEKDQANDLLQQYCEKQGIRWLDLTARFRATTHPDQLFLKSLPVLSAAGQRLYAGELIAELQPLLPGQSPGARPASRPVLQTAAEMESDQPGGLNRNRRWKVKPAGASGEEPAPGPEAQTAPDQSARRPRPPPLGFRSPRATNPRAASPLRTGIEESAAEGEDQPLRRANVRPIAP